MQKRLGSDADEPPKPKSNLKKKAVQSVATTADDEGSSSSEVCATQFGFCTVDTSPKDLRRLLLLDNQSTCNIFCNKALVTKVWKSKSSITVQGNGGSITTNTKAFAKNYGEVWFGTRAITNILSLKNVKNKYRVTYDSETEDVFTVHMNKGRVMQFKMHKDGLHILQQGSCHQSMEIKIIHHRARQRRKHNHKPQSVCQELWRSVV